MKIYLETMGCQMNRLDSELVEGVLRAAGHEVVEDHRAADVALYNTCSVRRHAEQKVHSRLGAEAQRKAAGRKIIVGVLGCMAQRLGEGLQEKHPEVDIVCGPGQLHRLPELIAQCAGAKAPCLAPGAKHAGDEDMLHADRKHGTRTGAIIALDPDRKAAREGGQDADMDALDAGRDPAAARAAVQAYVRVMRGCDKFCTYCIVPYVRGSEQSREPGRIAEEVRRLLDAGRSEITLLGQTVNSYHWRGGGRTVRFSDLLGMLSPLAGLRRLRFVTSHPSGFTDDILHAMRDLPNVCEYIHCPAQSGSDAVLKRMNRDYSRREYDDFVARARAIVPGVVLAGDFIVGFPGETEEDHAASADLIRRSGYKNSFVFKYSPRPGTAGARRLKDDVPNDVKKRRNNDLLAVQEEVGLAHHRGYIGRTVEVLAEGPSPRAGKQARALPAGWTQLIGRTRGDHIVVFDGPENLAGQYVDVEIADATSLTLFGRT